MEDEVAVRGARPDGFEAEPFIQRPRRVHALTGVQRDPALASCRGQLDAGEHEAAGDTAAAMGWGDAKHADVRLVGTERALGVVAYTAVQLQRDRTGDHTAVQRDKDSRS